MRQLILATFAALLAAAPAIAGEAPGFYAGVFAGAGSPGTTPFDGSLVEALIDDGGSYEVPTSIANDGVDPKIFGLLNEELAHVPFAGTGAGVALFANGTLTFDPALLAGATFGYAFGNGWRTEAELSGGGFRATSMSIDGGVAGGAEGDIDDATGIWTWTDEGSAPLGSASGILLSDLSGLTFTTDLRFALVNSWYDIAAAGMFHPYLGGGVGLAQLTSTLSTGCGCSSGTASEIVPAASVGGGVRVDLGGPVTLDLGYRYRLAFNSSLTTSIVESDPPIAASIAATQTGLIGVHSIQAGLTVALR